MFENDYQRHSEGLLFSLRHFVVLEKWKIYVENMLINIKTR